MQAGGAKASGAIKGKVKRNPDAAGKVGKAKTVAKPANKQRKTRQQKAEQTARIQATATKASTNPAVSKSRALRNEQRAIRARKLNAIYKSPPIVEMSRGQKDRMIRVRREFGVKSTAQSPNFGSKTAAAKPAAPRAARPPKTGQQIVNANIRKVQNQKLRTLNAKIKEAGPNAAGLRLQKLQVQSNMTSTRPKRTPKQEAKEKASVAAAKARVATMRRVNRANANYAKTQERRSYTGKNRAASVGTSRRATDFYSNPAKFLRSAKSKKNTLLSSGKGFRLPRNMR
jgi:hypothetical protein